VKIRKDRVTVTGLFWDRNMPPIVRTVPPSLAAGTLAEILRQFAGLKAGSISDTDGTAFYNASGAHLFTVPPQDRPEPDVLEPLREAVRFLGHVLDLGPDEAHDLLCNEGEEVEARAAAALQQAQRAIQSKKRE
jgi:hypothetical protein